jgi:hypothetical protein
MMVKMGDADAFVSGLTYDYPEVIRPALQIHHTQAGNRRVAGVYIMIVDNRTYLFTDATVNIEPNAEDLAEIACLSADFARQLGLEPRVALLSFSNFGSTPHPLAEKVRLAVDLIRSKCLDFAVEGRCRLIRQWCLRSLMRGILSAGEGCKCAGLSPHWKLLILPTSSWPGWETLRRSVRSCLAQEPRSMSCRPATMCVTLSILPQ